MRLFVAVAVPSALNAAIEDRVVDRLRPALAGARWTRPDARHVTLQFLGEVNEGRVDATTTALRNTAATHAPFDATFDRVGGFPNMGRPRVLWLGLGNGTDELAALAADVRRSLEAAGFEAEDRPFRPHLTLARFPKPSAIGDLSEVDVPREAFVVEEVVLFRSQLHNKGARYSVISASTLGGGVETR